MSATPNSLSRELLRWIQSLDLAYSIKNVKRDFSNGFLVAEIFSRYYDRSITMHSYDNGTAVRVKKDNWYQLLKFFRKNGLGQLLSEAEVLRIIHCEDGAVCDFIKKIYKTLTLRDVQEVVKRPAMEKPPAYMKNTGSAAVKEKLRTGELVEHTDETSTSAALRTHLEEHESSLQLERSVDPDRFSSMSISGRAPGGFGGSYGAQAGQSGTRNLGAAAPPHPKITVQEIKVKQSNKDITAIRASVDPKAMLLASYSAGSASNSPQASPSSFASGSRQEIVETKVGRGAAPPGAKSAPALSRVLDDAVPSVLGFSGFDDFRAAVASGVGSDPALARAAVEVFDRLCDSSPEVATSLSSRGGAEFKTLSSYFSELLRDVPDSSPAFKGACQAFGAIGIEFSKREPASSPSLFAEHALSPLCDIIRNQPSKRSAVLSCYYSYVANDIESHVKAIKRLEQELTDLPTFVHALTALVFMEDEGAFDEALLDIYLYYASVGLTQPSPALRASSVAMLAVVLANGGMVEVRQFLDPLQKLSEEDTFWETRAQLLVVAATVLSKTADEAVVDRMLALVSAVFSPSAHSNIKRVGIAYLAPVLGSREGALLPLFLDVLLSLRSTDRAILLSVHERLGGFTTMELPVGGTSGLRYQLHSIVNDIDGLSLAKALQDRLQAGDGPASVFTEDHAQVLLGCVLGAGPLDGSNGWSEVWDFFSDRVVSCLTEAGDATSVAVDVILNFAATCDSARVYCVGDRSPLPGIMDDIFDGASTQGDGRSREAFVDLLTRLAELPSPSCVNFVEKVLRNSRATKGNTDLQNLQANLMR